MQKQVVRFFFISAIKYTYSIKLDLHQRPLKFFSELISWTIGPREERKQEEE